MMDWEWTARTRNNQVLVRAGIRKIASQQVKTNKPFFDSLCMKCKGYSRHYSCPPYAPSFQSFSKGFGTTFFVMLSASTSQVNGSPWTRVRALNFMLKPRLERILYLARRWAGVPVKILGSGPCARCRPCQAVKGRPCKKPDKKIYPLEATGVDCAWAAKELFNQPLEWYSRERMPEKSSVMGAVLAREQEEENLLECFQNIVIPRSRA